MRKNRSPVTVEAMRRGRDLIQRFEGSREEFPYQRFEIALKQEIGDLSERCFDGFVKAIAKAIDDEEARAGRPHGGPRQLLLWELEGIYRLGDGRRIAKRYAQIHHADEAMAIDDRNMISVQQANLRKREELTLLRPYWTLGRIKEQAIQAYQEDNPTEDVA